MKRGSGYFKEPDTQRLSLEHNEHFRNFEFVSPTYNVINSAKNIVTDSTTTLTDTKTITGTTSSTNVEAAVYSEKLTQSSGGSNSPSRINKFLGIESHATDTRKFFTLEKQFTLSNSLSRSFNGTNQSKKESEPRGLLHSRSLEPKKLQRFPRLFN